MTQTKAGRNPEEALKEIEAQVQEPTGPGALAAWQKKAQVLIDDILAEIPLPPAGSRSIIARNAVQLKINLAAMPQAQPDAELPETPPELVAVEEWCCECSEQPADSLILVAGGILDWFCDDCGSKELARLRAAIAQAETGAPA